MKRLTVWIGALSDTDRDPRPFRAKLSLSKSGFNTKNLSNIQRNSTHQSRFSSWYRMIFWGILFHLRLFRKSAVRNFLMARLRKSISFEQPTSENDLILLFDLDLLPFVINNNFSNKILLDFREIYTEQFGSDLRFRLFLKPIRRYILRNYAQHLSAGFTVSRGLVNYYRDNFQINLVLVRSVPLWTSHVSESCESNKIRIVYLGVAHPLRKLDRNIEIALETRKDLEFHLYLVGDANYINFIKERNRNREHVFFHQPVDFHEINKTLSKYDLGWSYFFPETLNLERSLPNKFFDYIQAGLGVICGPNLDMMEEARGWSFAFFASDYSEQGLMKVLSDLTYESVRDAKKSAATARSKFIWEIEQLTFLDVIHRVTQE